MLLGDSKSRHAFMSDDGKYIYHLGIIDYLQEYDWSKWGETFLKSNFVAADNGDMISSVPPEKYYKRYYNFMATQVIVNQHQNLT
jgi:hypothetical protein